MSAKVEGIVLKDITPKVPDYAKPFIKLNLNPKYFEFIIRGEGVNVAIANGIQRALKSEIPLKRLELARENLETNDPTILEDFVIQRLSVIPIKQSVKEDTKITLEFMNNSSQEAEITTSYLKTGLTSPIFDDSITITTLKSMRFIRFKEINIVKGYGYHHAGHNATYGSSCVPIDQEPFDQTTNKGIPSSVSDPRAHKISFYTNGTMEPKEIVKLACIEIARRLNDIYANSTFHKSEDIHRLVIPNENDTTGNIIVKTICDTNPKISACTYSVDLVNKVLTVDIRDDDPSGVLKVAIEKAIKELKKIESAF